MLATLQANAERKPKAQFKQDTIGKLIDIQSRMTEGKGIGYKRWLTKHNLKVITVVCGFNRKFYKQCNSQQLVCDMQFTVVANESNRELRWQGASAGAHPVFVLYLIF